jgi:shikimate dehydrogenase
VNKSRYAVLGDPVDHSLSPQIHQDFARQANLALVYEKIHCTAVAFDRTLRRFFLEGGSGVNITVPHKSRAANWVDKVTGTAKLAGAVNTIVKHEDFFEGYNTDGIGLKRDLINHGFNTVGKRILVLGAGGAARGTLAILAQESPEALVIANRTSAKGEELAAHMQSYFPEEQISAAPLSDLALDFDLIINATSAGIEGQGKLLDGSVAEGDFCYDLFYSQNRRKPTPFCNWAIASGADQAIDGLGMLVEQAAESFYLWTGYRPQGKDTLVKIEKQMV